MGKVIAGLIIVFLVFAYVSDFTDGDDIPYSLSGMHVFVVDKESNNELHKANELYTSYFDSDTAIKNCKVEADIYANLKNINDYSYYCCTVTPSNECVSKLK